MPRLVDDWRDCWRWFSTHALAAAIALQAAWMELPASWTAQAPDWVVHGLTIAVLVLGFVGRLVAQDRPEAEP